jgi:putative ABC transport system permease protein
VTTPARPPWAVRIYTRAAGWLSHRVAGDLSGDAVEAFAAVYDDERRRGRRRGFALWVRAMIDLIRVALKPRMPLGHALGQDIKWSWRMMRRRRGVSVAVIASMALAIGASTAAFSVIDAFMLRSWNDNGMERVVRVREDFARSGQPPDVRGFSVSSLGPWRRNNTVFEGLAAGTGASATLMRDGRPERVAAGLITANFFDVLGIRPRLGRTFTAEEDSPSRRDAVILGDALWRSHFNADPSVIGQSVQLNGRARTIVGVMPPGLRHPYQSDLWVPLGRADNPADTTQVYAPARLKPGVTVERANAELNEMAKRLAAANPGPSTPTGASVTLLRPEMLGNLSFVSMLLGAAALLVLLIAVANVSNLLLAQSLDLKTDSALRSALGASRWRLVRQVLIYSVMLSGIGGLAGMLFTVSTAGRLIALSPAYGAGEFDIQPRLDGLTLVFAAAVTIGAGMLFGLLPAFRLSRAHAVTTLTESGRSGTLSKGSRRWFKGFAVAELALAFVLLAGAALMGQSLLALHRRPWGFDRSGVQTFDVALTAPKYRERDQRLAFVRDALDRLSRLPGVTAVAATSTPPLDAGTSAAAFNVENGPAPSARGFFVTNTRSITPGYFAALRIPIVAGRDFTEHDEAQSAPVVIVSQSFAERYWPGSNPLGQRVKAGPVDGPAPWMEVVGVAGTLRETPDAEIPAGDAWYLPYRQPTAGAADAFTVVLRTPAPGIMADVRRVIGTVDPEQPISDTLTMQERFDRFTATERLTTGLTAALGAMGLFLAAIGIYALLAFSLSRRLPELGIRTALGASSREIRGLVIREAMTLSALGIAAGAAIAVAGIRMTGTPLPEGASTTAALAIAVAGVIATVAWSSWGPASRAGRVDPLIAMRSART